MQKHTVKRALSVMVASAMLVGTFLPLSVFAEGTPEIPQQKNVLIQEVPVSDAETNDPDVQVQPEMKPAATPEPEMVPESTQEPETAMETMQEFEPETVQKTEPEAVPETAAAPETAPELVDANVLLGLLPVSNAELKNPNFATDNDCESSDSDAGSYTAFQVGEEDNALPNNGYENWQHSYIQYDFGKVRDVKKVEIYRNTYSAAHSIFKDVKVELSETPDFQNATVIFDTQDVRETNRGEPQVITLDAPVQAQYIRIWQKGHYIVNDSGSWAGMSNACRFTEIRVIAPVDPSELPPEPPKPPVVNARNIALGKLPYVYGLYPTNLEAITDGKADDNLAVHNSLGEHWLQFEYKNRYDIKQIKFKLEEGLYKSVNVSVSTNPTKAGTTVWSQTNWTQGEDMVTIDLSPIQGGNKQYVRFTVNRADDQPAKYSEIEIWATGENYDESKPEYVAPKSKYNTLVWSDEFNGNKLDETKWQVIDGMNNFAAIYNPGAVSVHDGVLDLNSKNYGTREALLEAVEWDQYHDAELPENVTWSSGRVETKNKFSFQNGRVAVRAKVNDSQGIWPAIWMLCQDETGHDEIDILEYLGQDAWDAYTTNHYGILNKNKGSHSTHTVGYEAWCQDFHVYEVEWDPEQITFFIDGNQVFKTSRCRNICDAMHTRPMFLILETQVGGGWVGPFDPTGQNTKPDSSFLIDWVHVYQQEQQPVARFDDLANIHGGAGNDPYFTAPVYASSALQEIHHAAGTQMPVWQDKDYFFYGGQPRVETDRVALAENAEGEQCLIYRIPDAKDVHLTTYYQTLSDGNFKFGFDDWFTGRTIRKSLLDDRNIDFAIETSPDGKTWTHFDGTKVVDNYIDAHPGYARTTFDAYGLPDGTNYVKVVFPNLDGVQYSLKSGKVMPVLNTDVQLAKVTFMQKKGASDETVPGYVFTEEGKESVSVLPFETVNLNAGTREGYTFEGWTVVEGDVTLENAAQTSFVMPAGNVTVKANWSPIPYTVTVENSCAEETGAGTYIIGDTVSLNAGTREGYTFEGWTVEGNAAVENAAQTSFVMPADNVTVTANWKAIPYTVTIQDSHAQVNGAGVYNIGDTVSLNAGTREGYTFEGWTVTEGDVTLENAAQISFAMPAGNVTVTANWKAIPYTVAVQGSHAQVSGEGTYKLGDTVCLDAGTRKLFRFDGWTVNKGNVILNDASSQVIEFVMPAEDLVIEANWTLSIIPEPKQPEPENPTDNTEPEQPTDNVKPAPEQPTNNANPVVHTTSNTVKSASRSMMSSNADREEQLLSDRDDFTEEEQLNTAEPEEEKPEETAKPEEKKPSDTAKAEEQKPTSEQTNAPADEGSNHLMVWLIVLLVVVVAGVAIVLYRKHYQSND